MRRERQEKGVRPNLDIPITARYVTIDDLFIRLKARRSPAASPYRTSFPPLVHVIPHLATHTPSGWDRVRRLDPPVLPWCLQGDGQALPARRLGQLRLLSLPLALLLGAAPLPAHRSR
jgi:hypothetical protein